MFVPLIISCFISICAYFSACKLIPTLKEMFIKANIYGKDMNKKDNKNM